MRSNVTVLQWVYEFLWMLSAAVLTLFFTWELMPHIDRGYFYYITGTMFLAFNYLRWILFPKYSPIMYSFWFKGVMLLLNIPLALVVSKYFLTLMESYDSFNFSYGTGENILIKTDASYELIQKIRTTTIASVVSLVILIIIFELRSIQLIFKWRQVPEFMTKN